jgi:hypothetical protein
VGNWCAIEIGRTADRAFGTGTEEVLAVTPHIAHGRVRQRSIVAYQSFLKERGLVGWSKALR